MMIGIHFRCEILFNHTTMFVLGGCAISNKHTWRCIGSYNFHQVDFCKSWTLCMQNQLRMHYSHTSCRCAHGIKLEVAYTQAENTVTLRSKLAEVVTQERLLLEEGLELFRTIYTLTVRFHENYFRSSVSFMSYFF